MHIYSVMINSIHSKLDKKQARFVSHCNLMYVDRMNSLLTIKFNVSVSNAKTQTLNKALAFFSVCTLN